MAIVRVKAADVPTASIPTVDETAAFGAEITRYWRDISRGAVDIQVHIHPPVIPISLTAAVLGTIRRNPIADALSRQPRPVSIWHTRTVGGFRQFSLRIGATGNRVIVGTGQELGQREWAWCPKCGSLAFWDHTGKPGPCAAGDTHNTSKGRGGSLSRASRGRRRVRRDGVGAANAPVWHVRTDLQDRAPPGAVHDHSASAAYVVATSATQRHAGPVEPLHPLHRAGLQWQCRFDLPGGRRLHQLTGAFFVGLDQFPSLASCSTNPVIRWVRPFLQ